MKILLLLLLVSCGKDKAKENCKNMLEMRRACYVDNAPIYGNHYAARMCTDAFVINKCY